MEKEPDQRQGRWEPIVTDIDSIDSKGAPLKLRGVRAERNTATGSVRIDPADPARAELEQTAERHHIEGRDLPLLLMLVAKPGHFKGGVVQTKYRLNKMLFYQWKSLEDEGLGKSYPRDEFDSARAGPVPRRLREDLRRLEREGMVRVQWSRGPGDSTVVELTPKGERAADALWWDVPEIYRITTQKVKEDLYPLDPETIKHKVHTDFPEFRRTYDEEDTE